MNEQDLRDCFAMFAMLGWCMNGDFHEDEIPRKAWKMADNMIDARKQKGEEDEEANNGIAAVAPKRSRKR